MNTITVTVKACWNGSAEGRYWQLEWREPPLGRYIREAWPCVGKADGPWDRRTATACRRWLEALTGCRVRFLAGAA